MLPPLSSLRCPRTLGFSAPRAFTNVSISKTASPALQRHLSVYYPCSLPCAGVLVDTRTSRKAPRLSFRTLQHSSAGKALFYDSLSRNVWKVLPYSPEVPPSGFGYPLGGVSSLQPRMFFSTPNALGFRPSELCSFLVIKVFFRKLLSAPALCCKTFQPCTGAPAVYSHKKSRASCPQRFSPGRDRCSPGPSGLSGSPYSAPMGRASLTSHAPHALRFCLSSRKAKPGTPGVSGTETQHLPSQGAGPSDLLTDCTRHLLERWAFRGVFFRLSAGNSLRNSRYTS